MYLVGPDKGEELGGSLDELYRNVLAVCSSPLDRMHSLPSPSHKWRLAAALAHRCMRQKSMCRARCDAAR